MKFKLSLIAIFVGAVGGFVWYGLIDDKPAATLAQERATTTEQNTTSVAPAEKPTLVTPKNSVPADVTVVDKKKQQPPMTTAAPGPLARIEQLAQQQAVEAYPEYYQGAFAAFSDNKYYAESIIKANHDNNETQWTKGFRKFLFSSESYIAAGVVGEQVKCSSKACVITGVIEDKKALTRIYDELDKKNVWGFGFDVRPAPDGKFVMFFYKTKLEEDDFID